MQVSSAASRGQELELHKRGTVKTPKIIFFASLLATFCAPARSQQTSLPFPSYMGDKFDYATFTRFDAPAPPKTLIYQSNGFMALQESGFAGQKIIIPVAGPKAPTNGSERLAAMDVDAPVLTDASKHSFNLASSPAKRSLTYFADRTVYRAAFENGPEILFAVYPVYGKPFAILRLKNERSRGALTVSISTHGEGFQVAPQAQQSAVEYGSSKWPYRILLGSHPTAAVQGSQFQWTLKTGEEAALEIVLGGTMEEAQASLAELQSSPDLFDAETHQQWNEYLASAPLVAPAEPIKFVIGTTGEHKSISPEELVRSELWFWRGVLNTTCQVHYLPACPMVIADWNVFMGMWSNDGIAEALALMGTGRKDLARASLLDWFRYAVNAKGDGTAPWTIFPSGTNTFLANGPERDTQGVPVQATLVGEYVRLTGDAAILNEKPGGLAGNRTVWEALLAYQHNLLKVRDANHDHLVDWLNTYETGWDDKDSPFIDLKGHATTSINEQVFNLWSLQEMAYLAKIQGEDPAPWNKEFETARQTAWSKLWDPSTHRYWDLDNTTGKFWTRGENLDAYYLLYFEKDPERIDAMLRRLHDPKKFDGVLLPTLAFDTPHWGGYWRGPAWPRIYGYIGMSLSRAGHARDGFDWLSRAVNSNLGPLLPENVDPKAYPPGEHAIGEVRIMGYDALDMLVLPDVAGMRTWASEDLSIVPSADLGKVYVRNQKWAGDSYDAVLETEQPTLLWRNGQALKPLAANKTWHAHKQGQDVTFESE